MTADNASGGATATGAIVRLDRVILRRGGHVVLDVPALEVLPGETVAVVGPNGAGKSTLLQVMACLLRPTEGRVSVAGEEVGPGTNLLRVRRRMAMVLQHAYLLNAGVFDNVAVGLRMRGVSGQEIRRRVDECLRMLGIRHLAARRARELSGGEGQRVSLARAFVLEPEVLYLDEPFGLLDAPTRVALLSELAEVLRRTRVTTVFATHDVIEIPFLATRTLVMEQGRIVADGHVRHVLGSELRSALPLLARSAEWLSAGDGPGDGAGTATFMAEAERRQGAAGCGTCREARP